MIQMGTILDVADNSGAKKIACIHLRGALGQYGHLGDIITASVKEATPDGTVKKGAGGQGGDRPHGVSASAAATAATSASTPNAAVLINDEKEPIGTRVFGPVARELREKRFMKIISLAPEVI